MIKIRDKSTKNPKATSIYITGFDGLRTVGVLLVIFYHLNPQLFAGGYLGVPIFMVLSGYLITSSLMNEIQSSGRINLKSFFTRRIKRIYPALVTVLFATSTYILIFQRDLLAKLWQIVLTNLFSVYNWWQIFNGQSYFERFATNVSPFTHLWALSIEGQFYLIWPIIVIVLFRLVKKNWQKSLFTLGLAFLSAGAMAVMYSPDQINRVYYGTDTRAFSILLGCSLAFVWPVKRLNRNLNRESRILINSLGSIALLAMLIMILLLKDQSSSLYQSGMFIFSLFATILVAAIAHPGSSFNRIFTNSICNYIGKISYGIYLYQFPVMIFFENSHPDLFKHRFLYGLVELIIIFLISTFSYLTIEKYFAHLTLTDLKKEFKKILKFKNWIHSSQRPKIVLILFLSIGFLGIIGNISSIFIKPKDPAKSTLAKRIKANTQKQKAHNKIAEQEARKANQDSQRLNEGKKRNQESTYLSSTQKNRLKLQAQKSPINQQYEKYGLTQFELQLAQEVGITAVGDSVMIDGQQVLTAIFPKIVLDAVISRQATDLPNILNDKIKQKVIADNLLIGLGTNGQLTDDVIDQSMKIATPQRRVFWINNYVPNRPWQDTNNLLLTKKARQYRNLYLINWHDYVSPHQDWLYHDLTHPNSLGATMYGTFIAKKILQILERK